VKQHQKCIAYNGEYFKKMTIKELTFPIQSTKVIDVANNFPSVRCINCGDCV